MKTLMILSLISMFTAACAKKSRQKESDATSQSGSRAGALSDVAKLAAADCIDPDLAKIAFSETLMMCDGSIASGTLRPDLSIIAPGKSLLGVSRPAIKAPSPWDLRYGVAVGGVVGKLKLNCRNMVDLATRSSESSPAVAGADGYDTIDDYNNGGSYPTTNPWPGGDAHLCGITSPAQANWERLDTVPVTAGTGSIFKDRISGLRWTRGSSTADKGWDDTNSGAGNGAIEYCDSLDHGGIDNWRLPTQKELMSAYVNGVYELDDGNTVGDNLGDLDANYWSSSVDSLSTARYAYVLRTTTGRMTTNFKTNISGRSALCVSSPESTLGLVSLPTLGDSVGLASDDCVDPDLSKVVRGENLTMCDGSTGVGALKPDPLDIVSGKTFLGVEGRGSPGPVVDSKDLRFGVALGQTTGKLKVNCRNMTDAETWDNTQGLATTGKDVYDTIDDGNAGAAFPSSNPWPGGEAHFCGANDPEDSNWLRLITVPATSGDHAVFEDKISGLRWSRGNDFFTKQWSTAASYCDDLNHGGIDTWRLPTQKELMQAYVHGIFDLDDGHTPTDNLGDLNTSFWSATSESAVSGQFWYLALGSGIVNTATKLGYNQVLCTDG